MIALHYLEKDSMPYFSMFLSHIFLFESSGLSCEFIHRQYGFSINSKIPFMSSGDKPVLTLKTLVTIFCRFRYFADFYITMVLLGQNFFE